MSEAVRTLIQKRYNKVKCAIITDTIDLFFNTIANETLLNYLN